MKLQQSILNRTFIVNYKGKDYHVDYLNSDGQVLGLINRNYWEVTDEDNESVNIYTFKGDSKKRREETKKNMILVRKLINFCIKHFEDYGPKL